MPRKHQELCSLLGYPLEISTRCVVSGLLRLFFLLHVVRDVTSYLLLEDKLESYGVAERGSVAAHSACMRL